MDNFYLLNLYKVQGAFTVGIFNAVVCASNEKDALEIIVGLGYKLKYGNPSIKQISFGVMNEEKGLVCLNINKEDMDLLFKNILQYDFKPYKKDSE